MRPALFLLPFLALPAWADQPDLRTGLWTNSGEMFFAEPACPADLVDDYLSAAQAYAQRDELEITDIGPLGLGADGAADWTPLEDGRWSKPITNGEAETAMGRMILEARQPDRYTMVLEYDGADLARALDLPAARLKACTIRFLTIWAFDADGQPGAAEAAAPEPEPDPDAEPLVKITENATRDDRSTPAPRAPAPASAPMPTPAPAPAPQDPDSPDPAPTAPATQTAPAPPPDPDLPAEPATPSVATPGGGTDATRP